MHQTDDTLVQKWGPALKGIDEEYDRRVTAQLLENQAKSIIEQGLVNEDISSAATTTGQLGTFQKFAFPLVRRIYPELIAKNMVGVQPMQGPVSQVFYLGNSRAKKGGGAGNTQTVYSKFNLTYRGLTSSKIGSTSGTGGEGTFDGGTAAGLDGDEAQSGFDVSNVLNFTADGSELEGNGAPSGTFGGQIAAWPNEDFLGGYQVSAGERLTGTGIPEMTFHVEQEAVTAVTRKMRALWTLEASQDLKAYHNLDLERELTGLLSKELQLEIDRELIEDLRMIAYGFRDKAYTALGGSDQRLMDNDYVNLGPFPGIVDADTAGTFTPAQFTYDFVGGGTELGSAGANSNVFVYDMGSTTLGLQPRHVGEVYSNLLACINFASQDIYRTTMRGPGNWICTSPLVASMLESAAKLEGGIQPADGPTNMGRNAIQFRGKFMGRYDLFVDPMFPEDEIMMGYKGDTSMDAGLIYAPYIPLQQLPTVVDPESFQPRKGLLTRYGKVQIEPMNRFFRIIRIVGTNANFMYQPFARNTEQLGSAV